MDPYAYPGTNVLRNVRNIRDTDRLAEFEAQATVYRIRQLEHKPIVGKFDTAHLQSIHRYIFQGVFAWAGEFRTVDISKSGHLFGLNQHIGPFLDKTFANLQKERCLGGADLKSFAARAAYYLGEINAIHPFREGNGRTQREFVRQLAVRNGFDVDWTRVSREEMIEASRRSFRTDNGGLEHVLLSVLQSTGR